VVLDSVGKRSFSRCKRLLKPDGIYISSELGPLEPGAPYPWYDPAIENSEMVPLDGARQEADLAARPSAR
jgi:hypothetical protein